MSTSGCDSSISSNFNGTAIAAGSTIWFSSVMKVSGVGSSPVTLKLTNSTISFTADGTPYTVAVPNSAVTITPGPGNATLSFADGWTENVAYPFSGNVLLNAVQFPVNVNVPGGIQNVTWSNHFTSSQSGVSVQWAWSAAVYKQFSTDYNALGVKPVDANNTSQYLSSDHAGTPENYKSDVTGGATGGGGSNFTGGLSGTASIQPCSLASATTLSYINLPAPYTYPWSMVVGPDGALYFGEWGSNGNDGGIGRLNGDGSVSEIDVAPTGSTPIVGAFDAAGNVWFSNCGGFFCSGNDALDALLPNGAVTSYDPGVNSHPRFGVVDPNGNVWFALARANAVARVLTNGTVTEFPLPLLAFNAANPNDITIGPDGALWITEYIGNAIIRMDLNGTVTNIYPLSTEAGPRFISSGQDGNLWFTEVGSEALAGDPYTPPQIIKMSTSGHMTAYAEPLTGSVADSIRPASGGFVFTDVDYAVGFIDYAGTITEWPVQNAGGTSVGFTVQGSDGSYYFADDDFNRIGKITLGNEPAIFPQSISIAGVGNSQLVGVGVLGNSGSYSARIDNTNVATVRPAAGFPMNFTVTAVGAGAATLTVTGGGNSMNAPITVTSGVQTSAAAVRGKSRRIP
jgi:streptogramin lyase